MPKFIEINNKIINLESIDSISLTDKYSTHSVIIWLRSGRMESVSYQEGQSILNYMEQNGMLFRR